MPKLEALAPDQLYRRCDPAQFTFQTTAELDAETDIVGQERAEQAVHFGLEIRRPGYNLFLLGEPGSGRHAAAQRLLAARAATEPAPDDWCYLFNFVEDTRPRLLRLPAGRGGQLRQDMRQFVAELPRAIGAAFEGDDYRVRVEAINDALKAREEQALRELGQASSERGVALLRTPHGFAFAPMAGEDTMAPEAFEQLPEDEKARIGQVMAEFSERLKQLMHQFPRWRREMQGQIKDASRDLLGLAVGHLIEELKARYADLAAVLAFLDEVQRDVIETGEQLRQQPRNEGDSNALVITGSLSAARYQVNLLVDHAGSRAAPVVFEDNPIYPNLVGRTDHVSQMGTLVTNFTLIKPGALHRANGGYLVLDAMKLLTQPFAWEGLKRALRSGQVRIESLGQAFGWVSTLSLEPEPMPLALKVVLIGERRVYYLLKALDPDFAELFKVAADFESELDRDAGHAQRYAEFLATLARAGQLRPLDREAVARVIEHGARLVGDAERLSVSRRQMRDLLEEADHLAGQAGRQLIRREDVDAALDARVHREDRLRGQLQQDILRDTLLIAVVDGRIGQVNGLAVISLDDFMFAHPVRITATVRVGDGNVIDIEREAELGGPLHAKGVMILSAFLGARYARNLPLSVSASLVFEQSYGPVEGDSASLAELCALLSDLASLPVKQGFAVTGSVNQFGDVQAIGGVNEKIEGFFDICRARGLTGEQGVIIPAGNVKHLMLRADVVAACAEGRFAVHAVKTVDDAIELLTGLSAGEVDDQGMVPQGTVNFLVAAELAELSAVKQAFASAGRGQDEDDEDDDEAGKAAPARPAGRTRGGRKGRKPAAG